MLFSETCKAWNMNCVPDLEIFPKNKAFYPHYGELAVNIELVVLEYRKRINPTKVFESVFVESRDMEIGSLPLEVEIVGMGEYVEKVIYCPTLKIIFNYRSQQPHCASAHQS